MKVPLFPAIAIAVAALGWTGCSSSSKSGPSSGNGDPWPTSYPSILTASVTDPSNDQVKAPQDAPPYSAPINYAPADLTRISYGIQGKYLYMRFEFAGVIPSAPVSIAPSGEIEPQTVAQQGANFSVDADNNDRSGAWGEGIAGIDIQYAVKLVYGSYTTAYANFDYPPWGDPHFGDVHYNRGHVDAEIGAGGSGSSYILIRFDTTTLGTYLPRGTTVEVSGWSEAESNLYHHFAFDPMAPGTWAIP